jgi:arabinan endo-1,5-alpha-L-arabinosidase
MLISIMLFAGCSRTEGTTGEAKPAAGTKSAASQEGPPVFTDVSVHDPSVIRMKNGTYYVFGSHLAAAKSEDLLNWELIASGVKEGNPLIPHVTKELSETLEWAQTNTLWAADVIQLANGKYYMYYNACRGDSPLSAMGIAVASKIEGPYQDTGIILKSGMPGESEDGTTYDARVHPNVVDPDVFYDQDGKLWMVYGSYSGGIFIMEMNPKNGKPLPGQGYGKKLIGGNHSRIEGPYMLYSPDTAYYYLFLSFGGLDARGGYNLRVVRSKAPDGPFEDAEGNDMREVKADPTKKLFDDKSIAPYGVKLMGNFRFRDPLEQGRKMGYVSPGHNSAYYDEDTGQYALIFHTRFPAEGERHEVRVHPFTFNAAGWPVVAPLRYAGEPDATVKPMDRRQVPGEYELVDHGKDISAKIKESAAIRLEADGRVTGAISGKWHTGDGNKLLLTADGHEYAGVWLQGWDELAKRWTPTFTVLSPQGVALWGARR